MSLRDLDPDSSLWQLKEATVECPPHPSKFPCSQDRQGESVKGAECVTAHLDPKYSLCTRGDGSKGPLHP